MKKIIPLLVLSTLVSCGKKNSDKNELLGRFENALRSQEAGTVIQGVTTGFEYRLKSLPPEYNKWIAEKRNISDTGREIILKVDGDTYYSYENHFEGSGGSVTKMSISLLINMAKENLKKMNYTIDGKYIRTVFADPADDEFDGEEIKDEGGNIIASLKGGQITTTTITDMENMNCDSRSTEIFSGQIFTVDGVSKTLEPVSTERVTTCPTPLTKEELKAIDLTAVHYCDFTTMDLKCDEKSKDMSDLVN
jgi:hypothetical protein